MQDVETYALRQSKMPNGQAQFDWYFFDIIGCITYLAEADGNKTAFLRFNTFNNMSATNDELCEEVKFWIDRLVNDSIGFSGQGSMYRNSYLEQAYQACDMLIGAF